MRQFLIGLFLSSLIASCVDTWPMLPPSKFNNCFKSQDPSSIINVPAWSVQEFKQRSFEAINASKKAVDNVRGCIARFPASNLTAALHIIDFNYTALIFYEIPININLVVLANGYDGEVFIVLNLRKVWYLNNIFINVDVRGLSSSHQHTLLVSHNFNLHILNVDVLRKGQLKVKRFSPAINSYQDLTWFELWLATNYTAPRQGAASYTVVPSGSNVPRHTYVMLNISQAPVLARTKSLTAASQWGVAERRCIPVLDLQPYSGSDISTFLEVMVDDDKETSSLLCRQRPWTLRSPPAESKQVARLRDFVMLEANRGPSTLRIQLEVGAALSVKESAPLLGLSVGSPLDFPEKKQNMSIVLLTDMVTRLVEVETNSQSVILIGRNSHLVLLRETTSLSAEQLKTKLLQEAGTYRELVSVNSGKETNYDSNFLRVLLGERAVTVADLATQMFVQCTTAMILLKLPMSSVRDLGLHPHRDIWIGNSQEESSRCYMYGNGSDLYRVFSFGGTNCGARIVENSKLKQVFTQLWININVGAGHSFTFSKSCSAGWNTELIEQVPPWIVKPVSSNLYEYDMKMYTDADLQRPFSMNNPIMDLHKHNYFSLVPKSKDVQYGVEVLDCFISWDVYPPESGGSAPAFHLIQSGCAQPWGRIEWFDQYGRNDGVVAVNRTVGFKLGNICYEGASASGFRPDFVDSQPNRKFYLHCRLRACSFQGIGYATSDPAYQLPTCYADQLKVCAASILSSLFNNVLVRYGPFLIKHSNSRTEQIPPVIFPSIPNLAQSVGLSIWGVIGIAVLAFIMGALFIAVLWYTQRRTSFRSLSTDSTSSTCSDVKNTTPQSALLKGKNLVTSGSNARRSYKCSECSNCSRGSSAASGSLSQPTDNTYVRQSNTSGDVVTMVPCLSQI